MDEVIGGLLEVGARSDNSNNRGCGIIFFSVIIIVVIAGIIYSLWK